MKIRFAVVVLISVGVLTGCLSGTSHVRYEPLVNIKAAPRPVSDVAIFQTQVPSRPYDEIGIFTYRAGTAESYTEVIAYFRAKAAEIGADGVIMMGNSAGPSMPIGAVIATLTDYRGMAIRYK